MGHLNSQKMKAVDLVLFTGRKLRLKGGILSYLCLIKNKSVRIQRKHRLRCKQIKMQTSQARQAS